VSNERPTHATCFAHSHDEPEPNVVGGFSLPSTTGRRTFDVKETRHTAPEAPDAAPGDARKDGLGAPRTAERGRGR
jgi:hypothetical protein